MTPSFLLEPRYAGTHLEEIRRQIHNLTTQGLTSAFYQSNLISIFQDISTFFSQPPIDFENEDFAKSITSLKDRITNLLKAPGSASEIEDLQDSIEHLIDTAVGEDPPLPRSLCDPSGEPIPDSITKDTYKAMHHTLFTAAANEVKEAITTLSTPSETSKAAAQKEISEKQQNKAAIQIAIHEHKTRQGTEYKHSQLQDLLVTKYGLYWYHIELLSEKTSEELQALIDNLEVEWIKIAPFISSAHLQHYRSFSSLCCVKSPKYAIRVFHLWKLAATEREGILAVQNNTSFIKKMAELFPADFESFVDMSNKNVEIIDDVPWIKNLVQKNPEHIQCILSHAGKKVLAYVQNNKQFFIDLIKKNPQYTTSILNSAHKPTKQAIRKDLELFVSLIIDHNLCMKDVLKIASEELRSTLCSSSPTLIKILSAIPLDRVEEILKVTNNSLLKSSRLVLSLAQKRPEIKEVLQKHLNPELIRNSRFQQAFREG